MSDHIHIDNTKPIAKDYINPKFVIAYTLEIAENIVRHPEKYNLDIIRGYKTLEDYAEKLTKGILNHTANISTQAKNAAASLGFKPDRKGVIDAIKSTL